MSSAEPFVLSESTNTYTTSFQSSPGRYFDEPLKIRDSTRLSRSSTTSAESNNTAVNGEASPPLDTPTFWGEQRRVWISANSGTSQDSQTRRRRTLVLCFDGTGDQFDGDVRSFYPFYASSWYAKVILTYTELQRCPISCYAQEG